jgi:hypothetical protein
MQLAVSLERGDLTVPFAASRAIDYRLSKAERMRNILAESGSPETVTPLVLDVARLRDAKHAIAQVLENADNPLSAMIAAFTTPEWPGGLSVPAKKD